MAQSPSRTAEGGVVERSSTLTITVDGQQLAAHPGDTVASALLASGRVRVGDSIYRGRPRGVLTADADEPNAFVRVHGAGGGTHESMLPATQVEVRDGLEVTFEDGIGVLDPTPDTALYDAVNVHCDVLVVGAGPTGLSAALAAAATGARVVLAEREPLLGGRLLSHPGEQVEGVPAPAWVGQAQEELAAAGVSVLTRTTVVGSYDSNYLLALERRTDHLDPATVPAGISRQRVWRITAGRVVLATGATERPLVLAGNDLPGVMLASAVSTYLGRFGVLPGQQAVVATTNDSAYATARELAHAGAEVRVVDARATASEVAAAAQSEGLEVLLSHVVVQVEGDERVASVVVAPLGEDGEPSGSTKTLPADLLAVSGGWSPTVHLHSQRRGATTWVSDLGGFVAVPDVRDQAPAGALRGTYATDLCIQEGAGAGRWAAGGQEPVGDGVGEAARQQACGPVRELWAVASPDGSWDTHFLDLHRDNTVADVLRSLGAGMRNIEHVKRYTSIGTGAEQGKTGNVVTSGLVARLLAHDGAEGVQGLGRPTGPGDIGTTTYRAPYTPVAFAALAGRHRGDLLDAARHTAVHPWHVQQGALFEDVGQWKRPWYYPQDGEDLHAAVARECRAVRENVGFMDASTLGKIEIRGADAAEFINRLYTNAFLQLPVGKGRYGMMCSADGMVFDDGVTLRLAEDRFFMTTTTGGAAKVLDWLEEWSQTEWPELDVTCTSVTEQWTTIAVAGPRSRDVVARVAPDLDVSKEGFGFMELRHTTLADGIDARICRITFSGELAFEINVPSWYGLATWELVAAAGADLGITPYGTETMHVLRAEKAFPIVGHDTDGTVTPQDLGMGWIVSKKKKDFVGMRSHQRLSHADADRKQWVSVHAVDGSTFLPEGTQLVEAGTPLTPAEGPVPMVGWVTSSYHSQALGRPFALALVKSGQDRVGERISAVVAGAPVECEIADTVVYDKEGARRDG
ncbi:2Fe-2S iron-sulfur cluster-binding protein [Ornithinimicrobium avium]|uniref:FAD-dependent oxidoreductase n=1 Tax=Ornithinimicrobium avium TaxID=2283195 RepID=A0A345NK50_9MICO|nr:2Fe-2S iron-sulfur cluster-binding protein [Ornithinimicrobium avium]AXH95408.1 FAD-dependent oxidoreductase [Ornithinimicrobium avium]